LSKEIEEINGKTQRK